MSSARKSIVKGSDVSSGADFGLLKGDQVIGDASALRPVSKLLATQIHPTPLNPRYKELCDAYVIQPRRADGKKRQFGSTHINKLAKRGIVEWINKVKDGWLQTEAGQAWLSEEVRSGHEFNFEDPTEEQKVSLWRAHFRRWLDRVTRMLLRNPPDAATAKRWAAITGNSTATFVREPLDPEARKRALSLITVWTELFALASNVEKDGLIQPVKVRPAQNGFQIVGGERRYWACCLASVDRIDVTGSEISDLTAMSQTIHENLDRSNISLQSQVRSMRTYIGALVGEPCGPDNTKIKLSLFEDEFSGRSRSWSHRWRVICLLPEGCEVLNAVYSGAYSKINEIDGHARAFLKYLKVNPGTQVLDADSEGTDLPPTVGNGTKPPAPKPASPAKQNQPITRAKVRLPGTEAGKRILVALKTTEGLDEASQAAIETALKAWPAAPENKRKKYLEDVIELMAKGLDHLDEEDGN